jgi:two-component system cell cycle response regulator
MQRVYRDARHLVTSDALTGLYNHGFLMEHLTSQIDDAKRFARNLTLGMLGIVNMAGLNRHYGYAAGDRLLRQLGGLASRLVRGEDLIARYSGTQFCVVLPDTPADLAFFALHRIASVVEHTEFALPDHNTPVRLTIKIGAASIQPIDSAESLIDRARAAMV